MELLVKKLARKSKLWMALMQLKENTIKDVNIWIITMFTTWDVLYLIRTAWEWKQHVSCGTAVPKPWGQQWVQYVISPVVWIGIDWYMYRNYDLHNSTDHLTYVAIFIRIYEDNGCDKWQSYVTVNENNWCAYSTCSQCQWLYVMIFI